MPNWAYTRYIVVGDTDQIRNLYKVMNELGEMDSPGLFQNDFGSTWFGNLVIKLGGDWKKTYCRGFWEKDILYENDSLSLGVESAWGELNEVRDFLEEKFPGIKIYYQTEEPGMMVYQTNDIEGLFFPGRYYLWIDGEDEDPYIESLEELIEEVEDITGETNLKNFKDCEKAMENSSKCYSLAEFEIND